MSFPMSDEGNFVREVVALDVCFSVSIYDLVLNSTGMYFSFSVHLCSIHNALPTDFMEDMK